MDKEQPGFVHVKVICLVAIANIQMHGVWRMTLGQNSACKFRLLDLCCQKKYYYIQDIIVVISSNLFM